MQMFKIIVGDVRREFRWKFEAMAVITTTSSVCPLSTSPGGGDITDPVYDPDHAVHAVGIVVETRTTLMFFEEGCSLFRLAGFGHA